VSVIHMIGIYEGFIGVFLGLMSLYVRHRLKCLERDTAELIEVKHECLIQELHKVKEELGENLGETIDEMVDIDPFEQFELVKAQMMTQVMGWGINMIMKKFGGEGSPELGIAEFTSPEDKP